MAIVKKGVLEESSGRIGNLVICRRNGRTYVRMLPAEVKQPNTPKQLEYRMRFALVQRFLSPILPFLKIGFGPTAEGRTAYNAAMSYNLQHALTGAYPDISIDYSNARVSLGTLPDARQATMQLTGQNSITITWEGQTAGDGVKDTDIAVVLIFSPETRFSFWSLNAGIRSDGQAVIELPEKVEYLKLLSYLSFFNTLFIAGNKEMKNISESVWCGEVEVAGDR
jgi:hypothetical protein